jgi:hypothetical protein
MTELEALISIAESLSAIFNLMLTVTTIVGGLIAMAMIGSSK